MKTLELHYPMIQFLIISYISLALKLSKRCQKAFDFIDKTRVKVSYEKFTANFDMAIKIQGRIHLGKLRITVERQVNLK